MPVKFEQNRMVQTTRNFELFDKKKKKKNPKKHKTNKQKNGFLKTIFNKELAPFWKTFSVAEIIF